MDLVDELDDDLDKFLDGLAAASTGGLSSCPVSPYGHGDHDHPQTIPPDGYDDHDDDFLNFINSPQDVAAASPSTGIVQQSVLSSAAGAEDFLDWLNDDNIQKQPTYESTMRPEEEVAGIDIDIERLLHPQPALIQTATLRTPSEQLELSEVSSHPSAVAIDTASTDTFIDDVFGVPSGVVTGRDSRLYSDHLRAVIRSNFPDTQQLRQLVDDYGYIPSAYRAQVWSLLLTEGCSEDDEVAHFDPSTAELEKKQDIVSDCDAVIAAAGLSLDATHLDALKREMQSVLMLYCQRRQLDYRGQLCRVLSCLLAVPDRPSVGLSSSCFYSIASEFLPFVSLAPAAQSIGQELTHTWLRTLLSYHSPAVVLHLDRVVPHWERPSKETSPSSAISAASSQRGSSALDELERELGLGVVEGGGVLRSVRDEPSSPVVSSDGAVIQSAPPSSSSATDTASHGCVPSHWITGVFSGSLPPREAALILDWAILNNDKYAGFYLSVSLLAIYSDALLRLSGSQIRRWFEDIDVSKDEWFKSIPLGPHSFVAGSWTDFIRGWLSATAAMIRSTPSGFKQSLQQTEEWACLATDRQQLDVSSKHSISTSMHSGGGGSMHSGGGASESMNNSEHRTIRRQEFIYDNDEEDDAEQSFLKRSKEAVAGGRSSNLMEKFRNLGLSFPANDSSSAHLHPHLRTNILHSNSNSTRFAQDKKDKCDAVCVWASPEEVIPCICSNRRRKKSSLGISESFYTCAVAQSENSRFRRTDGDAQQLERGTCFLVRRSAGGIGIGMDSEEDDGSSAPPVFFGIDCRSPSEIALGQFPKAYAFDPANLVDAESISKLLEMVETLTSSVHLCLIGVGEKYIRWRFEQRSPADRWTSSSSRSKKKEEEASEDASSSLGRQLDEYHGKLNAVAMFFLKKSFHNISILDGGFMAAIEVLQRPESPFNIQSALVEVDRAALEAVLGVKPHASAGRRSSLVSSLGELLTNVNSKMSSAAAPAVSSTDAAPSAAVTKNTAAVANDLSAASSTPLFGAAAAVGAWTKSWSKLVPSASSSSTISSSSEPSADTSSSGAPLKATEGSVTSSSSELLSSWAGMKWSSLGSISTAMSRGANNDDALSSSTAVDNQNQGGENGKTEEEKYSRLVPTLMADTTTIGVVKTEKEKEQALALHKMAGLRKGDSVTINRQELPGAVLFPSIKYKEVVSSETEPSALSLGVDGSSSATATKQLQLHRYLVVSRERFLVLDSSGGGVGSRAVVKSNRHLSELQKMSFRKKDPELVQLFYANKEATPRQYRVSKREEFVQALQKHMERFK